jgi:hypothetical protein
MIALIVFLFFQSQVDLTGTWKLDAGRSKISDGVIYAGLIRNGAPPTLHVTHAANGTIVIESQINESHSRIYKPGAKTTTPVGPSGSITMTSKLDGRTLVGEGTQESTSATPVPVKETIALSADGKTLTVEIEVAAAAGKTSSTFTYAKAQSVEPCKAWPTPCKIP